MKLQSIATGIVAFAFALFSLPAQAQFEMPQQQAPPQIEVSDDELELFIDASMNAQTVQAQSQQEMIAVVDEEGIEVSTYNEIMQAQQMGQPVDDLDVSGEDLERFESAHEQIQEIEVQMERQLAEAIEDKGMDMERFQEINMALQQDPELQQRAQQKIQEAQMQQQPQPQEY